MLSITDYIDIKSVLLRDARAFRGEAVSLTLKPNVNVQEAIQALIAHLIRFLSNSTGKMYHAHRETYSDTYRIEEPGHPNYGLKVIVDANKIYIQPIAILEDTDILRRYVQKLRRMSADTK